MNEVFMANVDLNVRDGVFLSEVYTDTERVMKEAVRRGHRVGTAISLRTGYGLRKKSVQKAVEDLIDRERPYCLVIAFPCGPCQSVAEAEYSW